MLNFSLGSESVGVLVLQNVYSPLSCSLPPPTGQASFSGSDSLTMFPSPVIETLYFDSVWMMFT